VNWNESHAGRRAAIAALVAAAIHALPAPADVIAERMHLSRAEFDARCADFSLFTWSQVAMLARNWQKFAVMPDEQRRAGILLAAADLELLAATVALVAGLDALPDADRLAATSDISASLEYDGTRPILGAGFDVLRRLLAEEA
jgi:hypothetical protein